MIKLSFAVSHALNMAMGVALTLIVNKYSMTQEGWVLLSAFLVSQTTRGTALRQGLIYFLLIVTTLIIASFLTLFLASAWLFASVILAWLIAQTIVLFNRPLKFNALYPILVLLIIYFLASADRVYDPSDIYYRMLDVIIGSVLGLVFSQLPFSVQLEREFKQGILPILKSLAHCASQFVTACQNKTVFKDCPIEKVLLKQENFPEWIYERGFNPALRSGFRFFLVHLERAMDIFSSLNYLLKQAIEEEYAKALAAPLKEAMQKNHELIEILIQYFKADTLANIEADFTSDITALEDVLQEFVPSNLELLDISPSYLPLIGIVRDIKDLRKELLQLVSALPKSTI